MHERSVLVVILSCIGIYIYIRMNAATSYKQGLMPSRTCNYFRSSNKVRCQIEGQIIQCPTKKQSNDGLSAGFYRIGVLKHREEQQQNISWFHLFQYSNNLWWHYHNNSDDLYFPGNLQILRCVERGLSNDHLFFGEMSIIPAQDDCWNKLEQLLINSFQVKHFKAEECYNCFQMLCLNSTSQVDHKYLTTLQVW
eukprot:TRINITY_DN320_c0_g1_i4.p2 TRINITY_DN320_c0_g1~~TRINITY_DN320_c0_g1_i4.p2  ORF type:complete len:195 (-),score=7.92 TRINITY_DN320_c0_g1_i4:1143-1727(-)